MPKKLEPPLTKDGKKDWPKFFGSMSDREAMQYAVTALAKMPMTYLQELGKRLKDIKA